MLARPSTRHEPDGASSRDDYVVLASGLPERFVVVVDLRHARLYAFEPRAQRTVERTVPRELRASPYSVAGMAFELLELIGYSAEAEPLLVAEPTSVNPAPFATPPSPAIEQPSSRFDGLEFGIGAIADIGLVGPPVSPGLGGSVDLVLAAGRRRVVVGAHGAGLIRDRLRSSQGMTEGTLSFRRAELGLHAGFGRRVRDRLTVVGFVRAGLLFGSLGLVTSSSGMSAPKTDTGNWVAGTLGVGLDARIPLGAGVSAGLTLALDSVLGANDYRGAADSEFHESPVRLTLGASILWGTSSLGAGTTSRLHR